ncbi:MAG: hypothetical protein EOM20_16130 [Spartobacteria bacterium]|nr:hypothetical protein [Spartobacteria bacterium]
MPTPSTTSDEYLPSMEGNCRSWKRWARWGAALLPSPMPTSPSQTIILTYHRIIPRTHLQGVYSSPHIIVTQESFRRQMDILRNHYHPLSLEDYVTARETRSPLPRNSVIITFDDGWEDNYRYALPVLRTAGLPATIFLTTGCIGTQHIFWPEEIHFLLHHLPYVRDPALRTLTAQAGIDANSWIEAEETRDGWSFIERLKSIDDARRTAFIEALRAHTHHPSFPQPQHAFLSWMQVKEMQQAGIHFGAHGVTHRLLTQCTEEEVRHECRQSRDTLTNETGIPPSFFAYPNGDFTPEIQRIVAETGYRGAVSTRPGKNNPQTDLYALQRINMSESRLLDPLGRFSPSLFRHMLS